MLSAPTSRGIEIGSGLQQADHAAVQTRASKRPEAVEVTDAPRHLTAGPARPEQSRTGPDRSGAQHQDGCARPARHSMGNPWLGPAGACTRLLCTHPPDHPSPGKPRLPSQVTL